MIHSFTDGHLGYFQHLAIVNNTAMNMGCIGSFELVFQNSYGIIPAVESPVVHLHNGILRSRKKEGAPTFHDSMDGTGEHYAK